MRLSLGSWAGWKKLLIDQFMLISYAIAAIIALTWPAPGRAVNDVTISIDGKAYQVFTVLCIMIVFLISGLALDTGDVKRALKYKMGVAFGFISTLAITPCLGFAYREIPLTPDEFTVGLVVNTLVPQTLGIGVSLVRSMMGNEGLALLLTVGTNFIGVFTMPLWLKGLFAGSTLGEGQGFTLSIGIVALLVNLIITVMVPSLIGKVLRDFIPAVRRWVTRYRTPLALFSTLNLAIVIWMVLSGAQSALVQQPFVGVVYVCLLSAAQHLLFLLFNGTMSWFVLRLPDPESTSTAIMASQKSGPVSVAVISYITSDPSTQGLMAIPAVLGQLIQAFIGSAFVPYLANRNAAYLDAQDKAAEAAAAAAAAGGVLADGAGGAAGTGAAAGAVAKVELELGKGPSGEVLEGAAAAWEGSQAGKPTAAAAAPPGSRSSPASLQLALSGRSSRLLELEGRSSLQLMASAILGMGRWGQADEDGPAGRAADSGGHAASIYP